MRERLRILVLYDEAQTYAGCNWDHLQALSASRHRVYFQSGTSPALLDLRPFDAVVVHHTMHLCLPIAPGGGVHLGPLVEEGLRAFEGGKILFVQDDYEGTEVTRKRMERIGFDALFTIIPGLEDARTVYTRERFPGLALFPVLAGYVPPWCETAPVGKPTKDRFCRVAYRGRTPPFQYGDLGQEKYKIGHGVKAAAMIRGVPHDIAWDEHSRIYGDAWHTFLGNTRATLVTESGSNVFDEDWNIRRAVEALAPRTTYHQAVELLQIRDGPIKMHQVSSKVFEAIGLRTALVAFPGEYSGVLKTEHYIRLEKDFSNVDEVLARLEDTDALQAMVDRAYEDIITSGRWSYDTLTHLFDNALEAAVGRKQRAKTELQPLCLVPPVAGARLVTGQLVTERPTRPTEARREILSTLDGHAIAVARASFRSVQ